MKIKGILYTTQFKRAYKKLPMEVKIAVQGRELIFKEDCFNARLKTHKLSGKWAGYWSFSVGYSYRVLFIFMDGGYVGFFNIGDHSIYQ